MTFTKVLALASFFITVLPVNSSNGSSHPIPKFICPGESGPGLSKRMVNFFTDMINVGDWLNREWPSDEILSGLLEESKRRQESCNKQISEISLDRKTARKSKKETASLLQPTEKAAYLEQVGVTDEIYGKQIKLLTEVEKAHSNRTKAIVKYQEAIKTKDAGAAREASNEFYSSSRFINELDTMVDHFNTALVERQDFAKALAEVQQKAAFAKNRQTKEGQLVKGAAQSSQQKLFQAEIDTFANRQKNENELQDLVQDKVSLLKQVSDDLGKRKKIEKQISKINDQIEFLIKERIPLKKTTSRVVSARNYLINDSKGFNATSESLNKDQIKFEDLKQQAKNSKESALEKALGRQLKVIEEQQNLYKTRDKLIESFNKNQGRSWFRPSLTEDLNSYITKRDGINRRIEVLDKIRSTWNQQTGELLPEAVENLKKSEDKHVSDFGIFSNNLKKNFKTFRDSYGVSAEEAKSIAEKSFWKKQYKINDALTSLFAKTEDNVVEQKKALGGLTTHGLGLDSKFNLKESLNSYNRFDKARAAGLDIEKEKAEKLQALAIKDGFDRIKTDYKFSSDESNQRRGLKSYYRLTDDDFSKEFNKVKNIREETQRRIAANAVDELATVSLVNAEKIAVAKIDPKHSIGFFKRKKNYTDLDHQAEDIKKMKNLTEKIEKITAKWITAKGSSRGQLRNEIDKTRGEFYKLLDEVSSAKNLDDKGSYAGLKDYKDNFNKALVTELSKVIDEDKIMNQNQSPLSYLAKQIPPKNLPKALESRATKLANFKQMRDQLIVNAKPVDENLKELLNKSEKDFDRLKDSEKDKILKELKNSAKASQSADSISKNESNAVPVEAPKNEIQNGQKEDQKLDSKSASGATSNAVDPRSDRHLKETTIKVNDPLQETFKSDPELQASHSNIFLNGDDDSKKRTNDLVEEMQATSDSGMKSRIATKIKDLSKQIQHPNQNEEIVRKTIEVDSASSETHIQKTKHSSKNTQTENQNPSTIDGNLKSHTQLPQNSTIIIAKAGATVTVTNQGAHHSGTTPIENLAANRERPPALNPSYVPSQQSQNPPEYVEVINSTSTKESPRNSKTHHQHPSKLNEMVKVVPNKLEDKRQKPVHPTAPPASAPSITLANAKDIMIKRKTTGVGDDDFHAAKDKILSEVETVKQSFRDDEKKKLEQFMNVLKIDSIKENASALMGITSLIVKHKKE